MHQTSYFPLVSVTLVSIYVRFSLPAVKAEMRHIDVGRTCAVRIISPQPERHVKNECAAAWNKDQHKSQLLFEMNFSPDWVVSDHNLPTDLLSMTHFHSDQAFIPVSSVHVEIVIYTVLYGLMKFESQTT